MTKSMVNWIVIVSVSAVAVSIVVLAGIRDTYIPERKFDCRMLIGGWHPDVPAKVAKQCQKGVTNDSSKTRY